jgi:hypothetical protein
MRRSESVERRWRYGVNRDGELTTEDLAQPAQVRQDEQPTTTGEAGVGGPTAGMGTVGAYAASPRPVATDVPSGMDAGTSPSSSAVAVDDRRPGPERGPEDSGVDVGLLDSADEESFRQRWSSVQARFVDDPKEAVKTADGLVAELMQSLAQGFSEHKGRLESQWQQGGDPDTEDLRQALQRYRSFFNRLLST